MTFKYDLSLQRKLELVPGKMTLRKQAAGVAFLFMVAGFTLSDEAQLRELCSKDVSQAVMQNFTVFNCKTN